MEDLWRKQDDIEKSLNEKFKKVDSEKFWRRDDVDVYEAAIRLLKVYRNEDIKVKDNNTILTTSPRVVEEYNNLIKKLNEEKKRIDENTRHYPRTSISSHIKRLAARINSAEWKVIARANIMRDKHKNQNLINESVKETGKVFIKYNGDKMHFTKDANDARITQAMSAFFSKTPDLIYTLDYNNCTNVKIKNTLQDRLWTMKVVVKYDKQTKTCSLYHPMTWKKIFNNVPIWEGVTIRTSKENELRWEYQNLAYLDRTINYGEVLWRDSVETKRLKWILNNCAPWLKNELEKNEKLMLFLKKVEWRLDEIVKRQKQNGNELDMNEPISRVFSGKWLMEAHFITADWKKESQIIFAGKWEDEKNNILPDDLYKILDESEWLLKIYLTSRIKEKSLMLSHYTMVKSDLSPEGNWNELSEKEKIQQEITLYWISSFRTLIDNLEWVNEKTNKEVVNLKHYCQWMEESFLRVMKEGKHVNVKSRNKAVEKLKSLRIDFKNHDWSFATISDNTAMQLIDNIFSLKWTKSEIQLSIRDLWTWMSLYDNTSSSHITDDILWDIQENTNDIKLDSKDSSFEASLKNINAKLSVHITDSWEIEPESIKTIDELYNRIWGHKSVDEFMLKLQDLQLLPKSIDIRDDTLKRWCENIMNWLKNKLEMSNKFSLSISDVKEKLLMQNNELEKKWEMTDDEMQLYQSNLIILNDDEMLQTIVDNQRENWAQLIKYAWVNDLFHWNLTEQLIKKWGWLRWNNKIRDAYNDAKWLRWWWDRTDETCEELGPIITDVLIDVAIWTAAALMTPFTWWTSLVLLAARIGSRTLKYTKTAGKLINMCSKLWKNMKKLKTLASAKKAELSWKLATKWKFIKNTVGVVEKGWTYWKKWLDEMVEIWNRELIKWIISDNMWSLNPVENWNKFVSEWILWTFEKIFKVPLLKFGKGWLLKRVSPEILEWAQSTVEQAIWWWIRDCYNKWVEWTPITRWSLLTAMTLAWAINTWLKQVNAWWMRTLKKINQLNWNKFYSAEISVFWPEHMNFVIDAKWKVLFSDSDLLRKWENYFHGFNLWESTVYFRMRKRDLAFDAHLLKQYWKTGEDIYSKLRTREARNAFENMKGKFNKNIICWIESVSMSWWWNLDAQVQEKNIWEIVNYLLDMEQKIIVPDIT